MIPRHNCLGLIEAQEPPIEVQTRDMIPRHNCLGLIEARTRPSERPSAFRRFRGIIASASLKLGGMGGGIRHVPRDSEA